MSSPATAAEAASLRSENATHRDLDALPVRHRESACAEKIFVWLALASRSFAADADFIGILDDDTFVHVERVFADLRPHTANGHLLYGQFSWAERWDARGARHHGYANTGDLVLAAAARHVAAAREGGDGSGDGASGGADGGSSGGRAGAGSPQARNGPFPLPLGFMMVLGSSLARAVGGAPGAAALTRYLERAEAAGRAPLVRGKCDPAGDASLGYVIAHVLPRGAPVTVLDLTSSARVHFWRSRASSTALRSTLAVMHHAEKWSEHFAWATCIATHAVPADVSPGSRRRGRAARGLSARGAERGLSGRGLQSAERSPRSAPGGVAGPGRRVHGLGAMGAHAESAFAPDLQPSIISSSTISSSGRRSPDRAPQLRCISVLRHLATTSGGGRRTGSPTDEARAYFTSHFGNWTWCERKEAWRRLPGLVLRNTSLCAASGAALLRSCAAGFAPSAEIHIAGAYLDPAHANLNLLQDV